MGGTASGGGYLTANGSWNIKNWSVGTYKGYGAAAGMDISLDGEVGFYWGDTSANSKVITYNVLAVEVSIFINPNAGWSGIEFGLQNPFIKPLPRWFPSKSVSDETTQWKTK